MLELYRAQGNALHYWWAWNTEHEVVIQSGVSGNKGDTHVIQLGRGDDPPSVVVREAARPRAEGYREIAASELTQLIIQFEIEGMGDPEDLDKRHRIEELMEESLACTGLGHWSGGDIGSGTMNICCSVVSSAKALPIALKTLEANGFLEGAVIAISSEEEEKVLWPPDFKGEFSI